VNKLKQVTLLLASLFIIVAAVASGQSCSSTKTLFQNKNTEQSISIILDDEVDDIDAEQISCIYQLHFVQMTFRFATLNQQFIAVANRSTSPIPFYLKVQNLRI